MTPVVTSLVAKDLYLNRALLIGVMAGGVSFLGLCLVHPLGIVVGGLGYLTGLIAYGCLLAGGIWKERETGSLLFSMSLPLSASDYRMAKMLGVLLSYLAAWVPLVIAATVTISLSTVLPHGVIVFITLLCVFLLLEFCLQAAVALLVRSEGPFIATMIVTNASVSLYWFGVASVPSVARSMRSSVASWDGAALTILAAQLALAVLLLLLPLRLGGRRSVL